MNIRLISWLLTLTTTSFAADIRIVLNRSFIDTYKDRVTITDSCIIDKALKTPHPASEDADIHIAARCQTAGLPSVLEIMNAAEQQPALEFVHSSEGTSSRVQVTGAWRLWCEHGGVSLQKQGAALNTPITTTNPDHVFEIHPITHIGNDAVENSIHTIEGYTEKDASEAFGTYERTRCRIRGGGNGTITLYTTMAGYNYVKFEMTLLEEPRRLSDGVQVFASISEPGGDLLVNKRRIVAISGTDAATQISRSHKGTTLTVLGIPRIDLSLVAWRVDHANRDPSALEWDLPYEMIAVAFYGETSPDAPQR